MDIKAAHKVYFKNLNALRFIAAFLVIIHHTEQFKALYQLENGWNHEVIKLIGKLGVVLFFVLSGFLISYLLFKEKEVTNTINIKNFYIRRLLKIWPLYFLIVFLAFFILPQLEFFDIKSLHKPTDTYFYPKFLLYVFFLPNLVFKVFPPIPYVSHTWSIGTEEQFYLIWPVLIKRFPRRLALMLTVIFSYLLIKAGLTLSPKTQFFDIAKKFWESTPLDCMAIGGLFALLIDKNTPLTQRLRAFIFSKQLQWIILSLTIFLLMIGFHLPYLHYEFYAILFGIIIVNFAANQQRIFSMENKWTNYLGKISYGLYMYHPIAIVIAVKTYLYLSTFPAPMIYPLVLTLVIGISACSFEFLEKPFIDLKSRYTNIVSGNEARSSSL
ncbi:acyltransferase family protein [Pedobacter sp.]|uniref:acyltransferase family protein n=1 Tax=Pedobacter sp. TaxID=1411316 RepID=UPI003D7F3D8B